MSNKLKIATVSFTVALALAGVMGLLWLLGGPSVAHADPGILYVAPDGDDAKTCDSETNCCETIQRAVDVASPGDVIKVATGVYTDVHGRPAPPGYPNSPTSGIITQVVYISKAVTVRGGYTTTNWTTPYPITQPTSLDAQGQGRVILVAGNISPTIEGLHVTGGDAAGLGGAPRGYDVGGGVYVIIATATISNNQVFSNTVTGWGGGLYLFGSNATLSANVVISNTAKGGGGLFLEGSTATLVSNSVTSNIAEAGGGLFLVESDATLISNTVTSNAASFGCGGGLYLYESAAMLSGNNVISNTADFGGGGLYLEGSAAMLSGNDVISNTANGTAPWGVGGGLLLVDSDATLSANTLISNAANNDGGGLFLGRSDATLTNTVIANNQAGTAGSGLYIYGSSPHLLHTSIARNSGGDGSGVYVTDGGFGHYSAVVLTNTILVSHGVGISVTGGNTVTVNSILWYGTPITVSQATTATVAVQTQHQGDPLFDADGYHLTSASTAAIDKGVDAGVTTDIDGDPRPQGSAPDLGADERAGAGTDVYLPIIMKNASP